MTPRKTWPQRRNRARLLGVPSLAMAPLVATSLLASPALARTQDSKGPVDLTAQAQQPAPPPAKVPAAPAASPAVPPAPGAAVAVPAPPPALPEVEAPPPVAVWTLQDAKDLLSAIRGIGSEGLFARDYQPAALAAAITKGEGDDLNQLASKLFVWLAEDLRDGRTPMTAREQWFAVDPDQDLHPNSALLAQATETHDVKGTLRALLPTHPDYALLRQLLQTTKEPAKLALVRANMAGWRATWACNT